MNRDGWWRCLCGLDNHPSHLVCERCLQPWTHFAGLCASIADEATFQIARTLNRSRVDSYPARQRWWRVYAAFPQLYRDAALKVWVSAVYQASKDDDSLRWTRPRELLARLRRPLYSV